MPNLRHILNIGLSLIILFTVGVCILASAASAAGTFQLKILAIEMPEECKCHQTSDFSLLNKTNEDSSANNIDSNTFRNTSFKDNIDKSMRNFDSSENDNTSQSTYVLNATNSNDKRSPVNFKTQSKLDHQNVQDFTDFITNQGTKLGNITSDNTSTGDITARDSKLCQRHELTITSCLAHHQLRPANDLRCTLGKAITLKTINWDYQDTLPLVKFKEPVLLSIPFTYAWPGGFTLKFYAEWACGSNATKDFMTFVVGSFLPSSEWILYSSRPSHKETHHGLSKPPLYNDFKNISTSREELRHSKTRRSIRFSYNNENPTWQKARKNQLDGEHSLVKNFKVKLSTKSHSLTSILKRFKDTRSKLERFSDSNGVLHRDKYPKKLYSMPWPLSQLFLRACSENSGENPSKGDTTSSPYTRSLTRNLQGRKEDFLPDLPSSFRARKRISRSANAKELANRQLMVAVRIICSENYFGKNCSEFCRARDDYLGHYTCTATGQQVCLEGWWGPECSQG
ncbi:delta-like protein [Elysia marginata]|uniref:Delta-like protein n=1 Tax=Elysia marginata TaxID=1093978 RepID=A0AAV4HQU8_9GAST|nr:delta-like protein [Elysia marginata]